jgi:hypothetical protein
MDIGILTGVGILWLAAAGITAGVAEKYGWRTWRWYSASLLTGPVSWFLIYLKVRDKREKLGPPTRRRGIAESKGEGKRIT